MAQKRTIVVADVLRILVSADSEIMCCAVNVACDRELLIGICSIENDLGVMRTANLMNTSALSPLNAQQLLGLIGPCIACCSCCLEHGSQEPRIDRQIDIQVDFTRNRHLTIWLRDSRRAPKIKHPQKYSQNETLFEINIWKVLISTR